MVKMRRMPTRKTGVAVFDKSGSPMRQRLITASFLVLLCNLTACDMIQQKMGVEDPALKEARIEAEGKAVGGACRHSGRAIEDCYAIYSWLPKAPIFSGWRDMDAYMRDNKIETTEPMLPPPQSPDSAKKKAKEGAPAESKASAKESAKESKSATKEH
jgi:hypothetical protein